jgi:HAE1 family hydrophobic/amphiphilic exporter-1
MTSVSEIFVRRPVMTTLVMVGILVFDIAASGCCRYRIWNVDFPTIRSPASTRASPRQWLRQSPRRWKQFSTIPALADPASGIGQSQITLQFTLERNIDAAALDVQSAISAALKQLPPTMTTPPTFRKVNPADAPIFFIGMSSKTLPLSKVDEYGESLLAQRLSMIDGVALVNVYGSAKYAVRIDLDPGAMAARGLGIDQVQAAVSNGNVDLPTGTLYGSNRTYNVMVNGQFEAAKPFESLIVSYQNGAPVRLGDIGHIYDGVQNDKLAAWVNGTRGVLLAIQKQPGRENTIASQIAHPRRVVRIRETIAGRRRSEGVLRPHREHPRLGQRRAVQPVPCADSGRAGHFHFLAQLVGDCHPVTGAADVDRGHFRDHVSVRLQPGQSVVDGADVVRRLRR